MLEVLKVSWIYAYGESHLSIITTTNQKTKNTPVNHVGTIQPFLSFFIIYSINYVFVIFVYSNKQFTILVVVLCRNGLFFF
jgi:hypothetical protein